MAEKQFTEAKELQLIKNVKETIIAYEEATRKIEKLKRMWTEAETECVSTKIAKERAEEELRIYELHMPSNEVKPHHFDIERFKAALPELLKKLHKEDNNE